MARLLDRLDFPDDWNQYPEPARQDYFQNNIPLTELTGAVKDEFDLPETDRDGFPYLNKEQWVALVRELDDSEERDSDE